MEHEIVTPEELAKLLKVDLKVIRKAIRRGQFQPGRHYFMVGDQVRFLWSEQSVKLLLEDSRLSDVNAADESVVNEAIAQPVNPGPVGKGLNWDIFK